MRKRAIAIIIVGFLTIFIAFAVRYAYGLLLPHMLPSLGNTKAGAGVVYSSYFVAYTIFSLFLGILVDRYDARFLLTFFVLLLAVGVYLMSWTTSLLQASIFFTLAGIGQSACWVPVVTVVQRWVKDTRRGAALAVVDLGSGSGIAVLGLVMPVIVDMSGWRSGWVTLGIVAAVIGILNFFMIRSYPPEMAAARKTPEAKSRQVPIRQAFLTLFNCKEFWLIGFSYLLICFAILIPFTFLTAYATENIGISFSSATGLIAIIAIAGITGKLTLGYLSDMVGRVKTIMACCLVVSLGGLGMALAGSYPILVLSSAVFGYGYGALWPIYAAAARDFFPVEYAGSVIGLWTVFLGVGSIVSPMITGWTIDVSGGYFCAFLLVMITGGSSLVMLLPISANRRKVLVSKTA